MGILDFDANNIKTEWYEDVTLKPHCSKKITVYNSDVGVERSLRLITAKRKQ